MAPEDQAPAHLPRRHEQFVWANSPQSQPRLQDILARRSVRQILHAGGVRWQATKTWKASTE